MGNFFCPFVNGNFFEVCPYENGTNFEICPYENGTNFEFCPYQGKLKKKNFVLSSGT